MTTDTNKPFPDKEFQRNVTDLAKKYDDKVRNKKDGSQRTLDFNPEVNPIAGKSISALTDEEYSRYIEGVHFID